MGGLNRSDFSGLWSKLETQNRVVQDFMGTPGASDLGRVIAGVRDFLETADGGEAKKRKKKSAKKTVKGKKEPSDDGLTGGAKDSGQPPEDGLEDGGRPSAAGLSGASGNGGGLANAGLSGALRDSGRPANAGTFGALRGGGGFGADSFRGADGGGLSISNMRGTDLRQAVAWSEILGEPMARKRRRKREWMHGNQSNADRGRAGHAAAASENH